MTIFTTIKTMKLVAPRPIISAFQFQSSISQVGRSACATSLCRQCRRKERSPQLSRNFSNRRYFQSTSFSLQRINAPHGKNGSNSNNSTQGSRRRTVLKVAAAGGSIGVAVVGFWDDIKHGYAAAERSARVATALAICINEYMLSLLTRSF